MNSIFRRVWNNPTGPIQTKHSPSSNPADFGLATSALLSLVGYETYSPTRNYHFQLRFLAFPTLPLKRSNHVIQRAAFTRNQSILIRLIWYVTAISCCSISTTCIDDDNANYYCIRHQWATWQAKWVIWGQTITILPLGKFQLHQSLNYACEKWDQRSYS